MLGASILFAKPFWFWLIQDKLTMKYLRILLLIAAFGAIGLILENRPTSLSAAVVRPNILVILTDDQDVYSLPVMRKLMSFPEGSWVNFTNAFVNNSVCCPSRATLLTGQYAHKHGVLSNQHGEQLDDTNTLAVWLDQAGYRTGLVGKYLNQFPWDRGASYVPPGWDFFSEPGEPAGVDR